MPNNSLIQIGGDTISPEEKGDDGERDPRGVMDVLPCSCQDHLGEARTRLHQVRRAVEQLTKLCPPEQGQLLSSLKAVLAICDTMPPAPEGQAHNPSATSSTKGHVAAPTASPRACRPPVTSTSSPIGPVASTFIGNADVVKELLHKAGVAAPTDVSVCLQGETGTGKEVLARWIHHKSNRATRPFIDVNIAALPADLIEAELFGWVRGAFTGAVSDRVGHLLRADHGTLFLDEIGEMPLDIQVKLLRVLETKKVPILGSSKDPPQSDFRLISATNKNLSEMVDKGQFRDDLYYRLVVVDLHLPPLRERGSDFELLSKPLLAEANKACATTRTLTTDALDYLKCLPFPGNVRLLQNVLKRACLFSEGEITKADIHLAYYNGAAPSTIPLLGAGGFGAPHGARSSSRDVSILEELCKAVYHPEAKSELQQILCAACHPYETPEFVSSKLGVSKTVVAKARIATEDLQDELSNLGFGGTLASPNHLTVIYAGGFVENEKRRGRRLDFPADTGNDVMVLLCGVNRFLEKQELFKSASGARLIRAALEGNRELLGGDTGVWGDISDDHSTAFLLPNAIYSKKLPALLDSLARKLTLLATVEKQKAQISTWLGDAAGDTARGGAS